MLSARTPGSYRPGAAAASAKKRAGGQRPRRPSLTSSDVEKELAVQPSGAGSDRTGRERAPRTTGRRVARSGARLLRGLGRGRLSGPPEVELLRRRRDAGSEA